MPKSLSAALKTHIGLTTTTLANCWRLERTDGTVFTFTDHVDTLTINDTVLGLPSSSRNYEAAGGYTPSALEASSNMAVDNMELQGVLDSAAITQQDIELGKFDGAEMYIFAVNYADLTMGAMIHARGTLGTVSLKRGTFFAEFRSLAQPAQQVIGESYSMMCRADLGDTRCGLNLTPYTYTSGVLTVTDNRRFTTTLTSANDFFAYGKLTWTSGNNSGTSVEVRKYLNTNGEIWLVEPMPFNVAVSDSFSIIAGCDKSIQTCNAKFSNRAQFRGEPWIPGGEPLGLIGAGVVTTTARQSQNSGGGGKF